MNSVHPINWDHVRVGISVSQRHAPQCLIENAETTKGAVLGDEIVDATKVSFGLGQSIIILAACEAVTSQPIRGLLEHAETTKRRADRFRHSVSPDCDRGETTVLGTEGVKQKWGHSAIETDFGCQT